MTLGEFKAFIEGMDVKTQPTEEQWGRIKDKLEKLSEVSYKIPTVLREQVPYQLTTYTPNTCSENKFFRWVTS